MVATLSIRRPEQQDAYCRVCGRASKAPSRGDCPGCSGIFTLQPGRCLYSPASGRLWFKSRGNGRLVNPTHEGCHDNPAHSISFRRLGTRRPNWGLLILVGGILYACLRLIA
jgi:hypothetical protein